MTAPTLDDEQGDAILRKEFPRWLSTDYDVPHDIVVRLIRAGYAAGVAAASVPREPVAWEWAWTQADWDAGRRFVGRGWPDQSMGKTLRDIIKIPLYYEATTTEERKP